MKPKSKWLILAGAAVVAGLFLIFGLNRSTQAQHFTAKVERGDIHDVVDATGTINAVILVQVGSQVSTDKIMSQQQLDLAKANYDSANAGVGAAAANVTQAEAQVSQKAAALAVAQTNLNYTVIRSPIDGTVVARNVDVGQTV